jgi:hypothetical protein
MRLKSHLLKTRYLHLTSRFQEKEMLTFKRMTNSRLKCRTRRGSCSMSQQHMSETEHFGRTNSHSLSKIETKPNLTFKRLRRSSRRHSINYRREATQKRTGMKQSSRASSLRLRVNLNSSSRKTLIHGKESVLRCRISFVLLRRTTELFKRAYSSNKETNSVSRAHFRSAWVTP